VINHKQALFPYQDDIIGIADAIMQRAKPAAVDATVINGVTVYEAGKFARMNRDQILGEISEFLGRPRTADEEQKIALSRDMQVFVKAFYARYFDDVDYKPFYKQSSVV
jgi:hypothetical protein